MIAGTNDKMPLVKIKNKELKLAFKNDCTKFLTDFQKLQTFKFEDFAKLWREYKFSRIYTSVESYEEQCNFIEMAFFILKKFITIPKNVHMQIGALFLLYGMYYKQPFQEYRKIRIIQSDYKILSELVEDMKSLEHYDPVYVFGKLKSEDAFHYVYLDNVMAIGLKHYVTQFEKTNDICETHSSDDLKKTCQRLSDTNLPDLNALDTEYRSCFAQVLEKYGSSSIQTFSTNVSEEIKKIFESNPEIKAEEATIGEKRRMVKLKAMQQPLNRKFRSSVNLEKTKTPPEATITKPEIDDDDEDENLDEL